MGLHVFFHELFVRNSVDARNVEIINDRANNNSNVPLGQPPLRVWELTSNSTRYDRYVAAPSDATMHQMWTGWAVIFGIVAGFVG